MNTTSTIARILSEFISPVYPVPPEILEKLAEKAHRRQISRNDKVCEEDHVFDQMIWVSEGIFRVSRIMNGEDHTIAFGTRGDPYLSIDYCLYGEPSKISYNPEVDGEIIYMRVEDFMEIVQNTELIKWFNKVLMRQIHALENRYIWLGQQSASSRYLQMIKLRPEVVTSIPLKYIASYLGVTQSHLSRIRAKIAGK